MVNHVAQEAPSEAGVVNSSTASINSRKPSPATIVDYEWGNAVLSRLFDEVSRSIDGGGSAATAVRLMTRLLMELKVHIQIEENDGVFAQIERDAPELLSDVHRIRAEHAECLCEAKHLIELGRNADDDDRWCRFASRYRLFRERVACQKAAEAIVVRRAYRTESVTKGEISYGAAT